MLSLWAIWVCTMNPWLCQKITHYALAHTDIYIERERERGMARVGMKRCCANNVNRKRGFYWSSFEESEVVRNGNGYKTKNLDILDTTDITDKKHLS